MNHIHKIIWSRALNCLVVASELARSHTGGGSSVGSTPTERSIALRIGAWALALQFAFPLMGYAPPALAEECRLNDANDNH